MSVVAKLWPSIRLHSLDFDLGGCNFPASEDVGQRTPHTRALTGVRGVFSILDGRLIVTRRPVPLSCKQRCTPVDARKLRLECREKIDASLTKTKDAGARRPLTLGWKATRRQ